MPLSTNPLKIVEVAPDFSNNSFLETSFKYSFRLVQPESSTYFISTANCFLALESSLNNVIIPASSNSRLTNLTRVSVRGL